MKEIKDIESYQTYTLGDLTLDLKDDEFINKKDGLVYCKICKTPRVLREPYTGHYVYCQCKHLAEEWQATKNAEEKAFEQQIKQKALDNTLLDKRYQNLTFDKANLNRDETFIIAYNRCKQYCEVSAQVMEKAYGIYLLGESGTGKTFLMACMVNELLRQGYTCKIANMFEIAKRIKKTYTTKGIYGESDYLEKITHCDFLFIDDLGTERVQSNGEDNWMQERVYDFINDRYNAMKPTIFSSNLSLLGLIKTRGFLTKTVDRIEEMATAVLEIKGETYRKEKKKEIGKEDIPY